MAILKKLTEVLHPSWDKERILREMGLPDDEENWRRVFKIILKARKAAEMRQHDMPVVRGISIGGEFGYHLVGFTNHNGRFHLYPARVSEGDTG